MNLTLFTGGRFLDPEKDRLLDGIEVLVEGDRIREVSDRPITASRATRIDLRGRTLMPGLIDMHVHVVSAVVNGVANAMTPSSLVALRAGRVMNAMLMRGFTTVRDLGGADLGLVLAVEEGLIAGPRLIICGKALSQTGGHADFRGRYDDAATPLTRHRLGALGRICDGLDQVRRAAREEMKGGADFIKIMANGGCASPTDPIHFLGFSVSELEAVVEEARMAGTYVSAHVYTDEAIRRCVEAGVHSLEHCNLIEAETAKLAASRGAVAVPTLVTYDKLVIDGPKLGFPPDSVAKVDVVRSAGMNSLAVMKKAGLAMAYGSDLLGEMHKYQSEEFVIRGRALPAHEVIGSATHVAAKLLRLEGKIGTIAPGAHADLIVVDGDPLKDLSLLTRQGKHIPLIMKGGAFMKRASLG